MSLEWPERATTDEIVLASGEQDRVPEGSGINIDSRVNLWSTYLSCTCILA